MPAKKKLTVKMPPPSLQKPLRAQKGASKKKKPQRNSSPSEEDPATSRSRSRSRSPRSPRSPTPPHVEEEDRPVLTHPPPTPQEKKTKNKTVVLSEEQEINLGEWLRQHPLLYDKGLKDYKDTGKKIDVWIDKAVEMGKDGDFAPKLKVWYESVRTKVGKLLSDGPSGSATKEKSQRDTFLLAHFSFLHKHIARQKGKTAFSLLPRLGTASPSPALERSPSEASVDVMHPADDDDDDPLSLTTSSQPSSRPLAQSSCSKGKAPVRGTTSFKISARRDPPKDDDVELGAIITNLQSQQPRSEALQGQITGLLSKDQASATAAWGTWIGTMARDFNPHVLPRFYRETLDLVLRFANESDGSVQGVPVPHPVPRQEQYVPMFSNFDAFQPPPQQQQQQQQQTFTCLVPPLGVQQQQQQQQQYQPPQQQQPTLDIPAWDTMAPTAGQAYAQPHPLQPSRPASTPNTSSCLLPNISDLSQNLTPSPRRK